jgi:hypothetical protein
MPPLKVFVAQKQGTGADGGTFQLDRRLENDLPKMGLVGRWSHKSKPVVKDLSFPFLWSRKSSWLSHVPFDTRHSLISGFFVYVRTDWVIGG